MYHSTTFLQADSLPQLNVTPPSPNPLARHTRGQPGTALLLLAQELLRLPAPGRRGTLRLFLMFMRNKIAHVPSAAL